MCSRSLAEAGANATETAKLSASDGAKFAGFGAVAISGDTVVVGAMSYGGRGSAYVFEKPSGGWVSATETAKFSASDRANGDHFGKPVAISGDTVVVEGGATTITTKVRPMCSRSRAGAG